MIIDTQVGTLITGIKTDTRLTDILTTGTKIGTPMTGIRTDTRTTEIRTGTQTGIPMTGIRIDIRMIGTKIGTLTGTRTTETKIDTQTMGTIRTGIRETTGQMIGTLVVLAAGTTTEGRIRGLIITRGIMVKTSTKTPYTAGQEVRTHLTAEDSTTHPRF